MVKGLGSGLGQTSLIPGTLTLIPCATLGESHICESGVNDTFITELP